MKYIAHKMYNVNERCIRKEQRSKQGHKNKYMYIHVHVSGCVLCVDRLKAVKTAEELSDVYAQFSLYYGRDLVDMQHRKTMQKRQGEGEAEEQVRGRGSSDCRTLSQVHNMHSRQLMQHTRTSC